MIYTPPRVGPTWFSDLFYFLLSSFVRTMEVFYAALDALLALTGFGS